MQQLKNCHSSFLKSWFTTENSHLFYKYGTPITEQLRHKDIRLMLHVLDEEHEYLPDSMLHPITVIPIYMYIYHI